MKIVKHFAIALTISVILLLFYGFVSWNVFQQTTVVSKRMPKDCMPKIEGRPGSSKQKRDVSLWERFFGEEEFCATY